MNKTNELDLLRKSPDVAKLLALLGYHHTEPFELTNDITSNGTIDTTVPSTKLIRGAVCESNYGKVIIRSGILQPYERVLKIEYVEVSPLTKTMQSGIDYIVINNEHFVPKEYSWKLLISDIISVVGSVKNLHGLTIKTKDNIVFDSYKPLAKLNARSREIASVIYDTMILIISLYTNFTRHGAEIIHKYYTGSWKNFVLLNDIYEKDFHIWDKDRNGWVLPEMKIFERETIDILFKEYYDDYCASLGIKPFKYKTYNPVFTSKADMNTRHGINNIKNSNFFELKQWLEKSHKPELMYLKQIFE